jgi:hypothetical protein
MTNTPAYFNPTNSYIKEPLCQFHQQFWCQRQAIFVEVIFDAFNGRQNLAKKAQNYGNFREI